MFSGGVAVAQETILLSVCSCRICFGCLIRENLLSQLRPQIEYACLLIVCLRRVSSSLYTICLCPLVNRLIRICLFLYRIWFLKHCISYNIAIIDIIYLLSSQAIVNIYIYICIFYVPSLSQTEYVSVFSVFLPLFIPLFCPSLCMSLCPGCLAAGVAATICFLKTF